MAAAWQGELMGSRYPGPAGSSEWMVFICRHCITVWRHSIGAIWDLLLDFKRRFLQKEYPNPKHSSLVSCLCNDPHINTAEDITVNPQRLEQGRLHPSLGIPRVL